MLSRYKGKNKGPKRTRGLKWEFGKMDIPLVASYSTPLSRRESSLFFSRPGPSRLQKLSVEDSYLLGQSDCHTFLRGPEDVSVKRGYTLPDRRVVSYMCVCVCVCVLLCVWFFTREGDWSLKCSELPPLSNNPLSGGGGTNVPCSLALLTENSKGPVPEALRMEARGLGECF